MYKVLDGRLIELKTMKELLLEGAKGGRRHSIVVAAKQRFNSPFFSTISSGLWLLAALWRFDYKVKRNLEKLKRKSTVSVTPSVARNVCTSMGTFIYKPKIY